MDLSLFRDDSLCHRYNQQLKQKEDEVQQSWSWKEQYFLDAIPNSMKLKAIRIVTMYMV